MFGWLKIWSNEKVKIYFVTEDSDKEEYKGCCCLETPRHLSSYDIESLMNRGYKKCTKEEFKNKLSAVL